MRCVRNEHANVQYRVNGVILPEGIWLFGSGLSPRFASRVDRTPRSAQGFNLGPLGGFEVPFDIVNVANNNYLLGNGTGIGVFTTQFGSPRGFFAGLTKVF